MPAKHLLGFNEIFHKILQYNTGHAFRSQRNGSVHQGVPKMFIKSVKGKPVGMLPWNNEHNRPELLVEDLVKLPK